MSRGGEPFGRAYAGMGLADKNGHRCPETFTARDLMAHEPPPVRWAVPGLAPEGVTLLAGKAKMGKSWLVLALCIATAAGGAALGKVPVERGQALYLALEDNPRRLYNRLGKLLGGGEPPMGSTWLPSGPGSARGARRRWTISSKNAPTPGSWSWTP